MKKQTLFNSFTLVSLLFSGSAFATTNLEEAIVGKWGYARTFCEQGMKNVNAASQDEKLIITFDKMGTGQVQVSKSAMIPIEEGNTLSCTINMEFTISYSIDGDMMNFSTDAQIPVISSPDCPEIQDILDNIGANPQKTDPTSHTNKFAITTDGTQLQVWIGNDDTTCGENDKLILEYKKL